MFLLWKQLMQIVGQTWLTLVTLTCGSWSGGQHDLYFTVWPQNKCRWLWPVFYGPVILPCMLKTIWCMNIMLWDYGSVWPDLWPQNKCRSMWPIFHGPVILSYISKTIWCMSVIFSDNETVWPKLWPQSIYKSTCPTFHSLVNLLNILRLFDGWTS